MTRSIVDHVDLEGTVHEVRAVSTGAWGEYRLEVLYPSGWHLLGWIQKDTDRPTRTEWGVEDVEFWKAGEYPTLRDALSRAAKKLIEREARLHAAQQADN